MRRVGAYRSEPAPIAILDPTIRTTKNIAIHFSVSIFEMSVSRKLCVSPSSSDTLNSENAEYVHMSSRSVLPVFELLALFVIVYVLQIVSTFADMVETLFVLQPPIVDNPWTIVTSVFAHGGPAHLFSNAIALLLIGIPVALYTTRIRFYTFFVGAGAIAGISQIVLSDLISLVPLIGYTASPGVLGASGGVFALLGYLLAGNRLSTFLGAVISIPRWLTYLVFIGLALAVTVVTASPGAALIAHFTGLLLGLLAGRFNLLEPDRHTT